MTGRSSTSGITMQQSTGIRARQGDTTHGSSIAGRVHRSQQQYMAGRPSQAGSLLYCFTHKVPTRPSPLANRRVVRVRVPEHVARWLWLQLGPRRLAACVASAPELRDRTLFASSVRVDSASALMCYFRAPLARSLARRARPGKYECAEAVAVAYLTGGLRLSVSTMCL
jgi:hypothetical protein